MSSFAALYPSNLQEWQNVECISGRINVIHRDIGELLYHEHPNQLAQQEIFFYNAMYNLANGNDNVGTVDYIPIPPLSSKDWGCACTDIIAACQLKIRIDVHNAMKPLRGVNHTPK